MQKLIKKETILNEIIEEITSKKLNVGDVIYAKDYPVSPRTMGTIFNILLDNDIIQMSNSRLYVLTNDCFSNAQNMYYKRIVEKLNEVKDLGTTAHLPMQSIVDLLKEVVKNV